MNTTDHGGVTQYQQVIHAFKVDIPIGKTLAAVVFFLKFLTLDHGAHGAVQKENTFFQ